MAIEKVEHFAIQCDKCKNFYHDGDEDQPLAGTLYNTPIEAQKEAQEAGWSIGQNHICPECDGVRMQPCLRCGETGVIYCEECGKNEK